MAIAQSETGTSAAHRHAQMLIDGDWCDASTGRQLIVESPGNRKPIASIPRGTAEDVDRAVEAAAGAMAQPCYPDGARDLDRLIDDELGRAGLSIDIDARAVLRASLGGDRLASRGELEKLCLYATGRGRIEVADVAGAVSDVAETATDAVIDAVVTGETAEADLCLSRILTSSAAGFQVLAGLVRQFQALHLMRGAGDAGATPAAAVGAARPPVLFSRRAALERGIGLWSSERLERVLVRLHAAVLTTRRRPDLADAAIRQLCLGLAMEAAGRRRR